MKRDELLKVVGQLAQSQGSWGRFQRDLKELEKNSPEEYEELMQNLEGENFKDSVDFILFVEG